MLPAVLTWAKPLTATGAACDSTDESNRHVVSISRFMFWDRSKKDKALTLAQVCIRFCGHLQLNTEAFKHQ
jgi:hypothetical protein